MRRHPEPDGTGVRIGPFWIERDVRGRVRIEVVDGPLKGEGGDFSEDDLAEWIGRFWTDNF